MNLNIILLCPLFSDSLGHRASVRQALAKDEKWISSYLSKLLSLLQRQDNSLVKLVPGSTIRDPPSGGNITVSSIYSIMKHLTILSTSRIV